MKFSRMNLLGKASSPVVRDLGDFDTGDPQSLGKAAEIGHKFLDQILY